MSKTILVIEDNDSNMDLMIFHLQSMGYVVIPALNGPAGLAIARAERPDLILCDIEMPELDGYGVLRALRSRAAADFIPTIAVTALAAPGDGDRLLKLGFDGYMSKPVELDALHAILRKHLPPQTS